MAEQNSTKKNRRRGAAPSWSLYVSKAKRSNDYHRTLATELAAWIHEVVMKGEGKLRVCGPQLVRSRWLVEVMVRWVVHRWALEIHPEALGVDLRKYRGPLMRLLVTARKDPTEPDADPAVGSAGVNRVRIDIPRDAGVDWFLENVEKYET